MTRLMSGLGLMALMATTGAAAAGWHHPLYLGNDGYWRQRVRVDVRSDMDRAVAGEPAAAPVGRGAGEADLVGALAQAVRVCDEDGTEMLYRITGPGGETVTDGPIPLGSILTLPVECAPRDSATYYIYFDNPAAWPVPDFLAATIGLRNGDLEAGSGDTPSGWAHDAGDDRHRALWIAKNPHSGKRCLKTVVAAGAEPTWIATRRHDIHIVGGARYVMRAWVKAENVAGYAGWYIHVGNDNNFMIISPMLDGGGGTYDWKEVSAEFTAPREANRADLGTVLRGTGTAWFDDVTLECAEPSKLTATAAAPEKLQVRELGADAPWYDDNPDDDIYWDCRLPIRVMNLSDEALTNTLVHADIPIFARLGGRFNPDSIRVTDGARPVRHYRFEDSVLFEGQAPAHTVHTYYIYFSLDDRVGPSALADYGALVASERNLVRNPSFESGADVPEDWPGSAEGDMPAGGALGFDQPGLFGKRCVKMHIPHGAEPAWTGWRQDVPVEPGKAYLYAAWLKAEDVGDGSVSIYAHYRNAAGKLCETKQTTSAGPDISGTRDWTLLGGWFEMPPDIATFQLHLTMHEGGTVWHDGVLLARVTPGVAGRFEQCAAPQPAAPTLWPVNAVVKVFQDDMPPREIAAARISAARNEREPLQLAVRSPRALRQVTVEVDAPTSADGATLTDSEIAVVGYVPIDHQTAYYSDDSPAWHRKYPTTPGSCDGWAGMWPDPLLPRDTFDLRANATQPVWITVSVPRDAAAGDYLGRVRLRGGGAAPSEIPFTVHVWDFALPDHNHVKAIYDVRLDGRWAMPGQSPQQTREQFWRFMADHRVCPDTIQPEPVITYADGKVTADFTEFDRAARYYFDTLKLPHIYTPWSFYCFGWGHPPQPAFGEKPYEGDSPYEGADRSRLRPEYKRAYQACLKVFWEHLKAKGWDRKCVLYISDEPHYDKPEIKAQMKALCDMIHEVNPEIPIYCSTWRHYPEWNGYLDVWGIGHYGIVPPQEMAQMRGAGDRVWFTTDGQMCTDTPYCAVERLLPHYCFKYGVEAYEFWGINWLTYDPYKFGWHAYIHQSGEPGEYTWVRYPNGDGFLAYPGAPVSQPRAESRGGPVSSVRLEQAREGVEDYECLYLLRDLVARAQAAGEDTTSAQAAMQKANDLVDIPNAGGRYSTKILPDPEAVFRAKEAVARAIEELRAR